MIILPGLAAPLIGLAGSALSGMFGAAGARRTNRVNQQEAARNRRFQERMRNTQWQAGVADMQAAGLNPALAYSQGGASSPGGSMPAAAANVVSSGLEASRMTKTMKLLDAQVSKTKEEAKGARAEATLKADRANYLTARGTLTDPSGRKTYGVPLLNDLIDSEVSSARAGATNTAALADRNRELARIAKPLGDLSGRMGEILPIIAMLTTAGGPASSMVRTLVRGRKSLPKVARKIPFQRPRSARR